MSDLSCSVSLVAHRYRMTPTGAQAEVMREWCAHARTVWNVGLEQRNVCFELARRRGVKPPKVDKYEQKRQLSEARSAIEWLGAGPSVVHQQALLDLDQAFQNWWKNPGHFGRPTWRKAGIHEGFTIRDVKITKLSRKWAQVLVPKVGYVRFRLHRPLPAAHGQGRVTLDRAGRWHVSFAAAQPTVERTNTDTHVGVDVGIAHTLTLSNGDHIDMTRLLSPGEAQRLRRLQRRLARQQKGSNRRGRTKASIAALKAKERNRRKDFIEQTTTQLVRSFDTIAIEDLAVSNMVRSARGTIEQPGRNVAAKRGLNREILARGWGGFRLRLEQKATATPEQHRCVVVAVNPANTSRRCARCAHTSPDNRKSQAVFECQSCGHSSNADVNAAINILAAGLAVTGRGGTPHAITAQRPNEASTSLNHEKAA